MVLSNLPQERKMNRKPNTLSIISMAKLKESDKISQKLQV
jgi:hypothetical protein